MITPSLAFSGPLSFRSLVRAKRLPPLVNPPIPEMLFTTTLSTSEFPGPSLGLHFRTLTPYFHGLPYHFYMGKGMEPVLLRVVFLKGPVIL